MNHRTQHLQIQAAAKCIRSGGVLAYPTESCFGLGCDPLNKQAVKRILNSKQRSADKGLILVADNLDQLQPFIAWHKVDAKQQAFVQTTWPAAVSFVIPAAAQCSELLRGQHAGLAVRIPKFHLMRELCLEAATAIVSTSANRAGQVPALNAKQVEKTFAEEVDYVLDLPIMGNALPSKIIDAISLKTLRKA